MSIIVFLGSAYFSLISNNSVFITPNILSSLDNIALSSSIVFNNSANSSRIFSFSKPVNFLKRISKIASV